MLSLPGKLFPADETPCEKVPTLFYADTMEPRFFPEAYVDITDEIDDKIKSRDCHVSQVEWMRRVHFLTTMPKARFVPLPHSGGFRLAANTPKGSGLSGSWDICPILTCCPKRGSDDF
jgi:LmbE family N-acetylglucosaminyl deacetylase